MSLKRKQMCEVLPFADASDFELAAFYNKDPGVCKFYLNKHPEYTIAALQICVADEICKRFAKTYKTYNIDVESDKDEVEDDESVSLGSQDTSNSSEKN